MKKIYFCLVFSIFFNMLLAQKPFISTPATTLTVPLPANTFTTAKISMVNQTSGSLTLKWLKYVNTIPSTWVANLCDYNTCYTGVPNLGTMSPISGLTEGFIKFDVNPFSYTGSATAVIYVYSGSAPTLGDTLIFNFIASGITEIENTVQPEHEKVTFLPNAIQIQNFQERNEVCLTDIQGKTLLYQTIMSYNHEIINTQNLVPGLYFVRTRYQNYKYFKQ